MVDTFVHGRLDALQDRVTRLEHAIQALAQATGITLPEEFQASVGPGADPVAEEIAALVRAGERMKAIKVANAKLRLSLMDATQYVARMEGTLGE